MVGAIAQAGAKQSLSLEQLLQEGGSPLTESSSQSPKEGTSPQLCYLYVNPGPQQPNLQDKGCYLKIVFLKTTKSSVSSGDCLFLFIEDLRLGSYPDVFFRG